MMLNLVNHTLTLAQTSSYFSLGKKRISVFLKWLNVVFSLVVTDSLPFCCWLRSSQTEANQFTGMVYQGLLLSERKRLRTESIEEHVTPNSAPAQWPGNKAPAFPTADL